MAQAPRQSTRSAEDFLHWEARQAERHELVGGEVFAMAGAEDRHVTISLNLALALRQHLAGSPCRTFMADMKLQCAQNFFYPDVFVTCEPADRARSLAKQAPTLIVEVLSPSTTAYDRGVKFAHYRQIASLREVVFVDPDSRCCDGFRRGEDDLCVLHPFGPEAGVHLGSVDLSIPAAQLCAEVDT